MRGLGRTEGPRERSPSALRNLRGGPRYVSGALARSARQSVDLLCGAIENLRDALEQLGIVHRAGSATVGRLADVAERRVDPGHRLVEEMADELADAIKDRVDGR